MPQELPIACSLSAGDLEARLAQMAELGREALIDRRIDGTRARLRFAPGPGVRERVDAIVAAESSCCPFLTLRAAAEAEAVVLTVEAPEGAEVALAEWAGAFQRRPAP